VASVQRGRALIDPHWILLLLLLLIKATLLLLGLLTFTVGLLVAWPVVNCITTAAYRQLTRIEATQERLNPAPPY
jgi:uncharacterized membrane protein